MADARTSVWESLLDAEMNVRYWGCLARRFVVRERALKIAIAVTASSALLSIPLWQQHPLGPILLGLLNTILACSLPFLNYSEQIETMANLRGSWSQMGIEYERLWQEIQDSEPRNFENELRLLRERTVQLKVIETRLPNNRRLVQRCQLEILQSRGLGQTLKGEVTNA